MIMIITTDMLRRKIVITKLHHCIGYTKAILSSGIFALLHGLRFYIILADTLKSIYFMLHFHFTHYSWFLA